MASGGVLMIAAAFGFLTVADDLRHTGELWGVIAILMAGGCLLLAGSSRAISKRLPLQWAALGIAFGMGFGAWSDRMAAGVAAGALLGLALAYSRRRRPAR